MNEQCYYRCENEKCPKYKKEVPGATPSAYLLAGETLTCRDCSRALWLHRVGDKSFS